MFAEKKLNTKQRLWLWIQRGEVVAVAIEDGDAESQLGNLILCSFISVCETTDWPIDNLAAECYQREVFSANFPLGRNSKPLRLLCWILIVEISEQRMWDSVFLWVPNLPYVSKLHLQNPLHPCRHYLLFVLIPLSSVTHKKRKKTRKRVQGY